jgi:drug/metabolite transporter (DMT)-like permease
VLCGFLWGTNVVVGRGLHDEVAPFTFALLRNAVALLVLLPLAAGDLRKNWGLLRQHAGVVFIAGVFGTALFNALVYNALHTTTAINAALTVSLCPAVIPVISFFVLKERLTLLQALGVAVSFLGVAVIVTRGDPRLLASLSFVPGDLLMLGAMFCWSVYTVVVRRKDPRLSPYAFLVAINAVAVLALAPFFAWEAARVGMSMAPFAWLGVIYIGVFPTALAIMLFNRAVGIVGANTASAFQHIVPLFGTLLAILFLGERLSVFHWIGGALIAFGLGR